MKKILSLIMLFTFIFTLASCVNPKDKAFLGMEAPFGKNKVVKSSFDLPQEIQGVKIKWTLKYIPKKNEKGASEISGATVKVVRNEIDQKYELIAKNERGKTVSFDFTVPALDKVKKLEVSFFNKAGNLIQKVEYTENETIQKTFTREQLGLSQDEEFVGWSNSKNSQTALDTIKATQENQNLYPVYRLKENAKKITINFFDKKGNLIEAIEHDLGQSISKTFSNKQLGLGADEEFLGWTPFKGEAAVPDLKATKENKNLYPAYRQKENQGPTKKITINFFDKTGDLIKGIEYKVGELIYQGFSDSQLKLASDEKLIGWTNQKGGTTPLSLLEAKKENKNLYPVIQKQTKPDPGATAEIPEDPEGEGKGDLEQAKEPKTKVDLSGVEKNPATPGFTPKSTQEKDIRHTSKNKKLGVKPLKAVEVEKEVYYTTLENFFKSLGNLVDYRKEYKNQKDQEGRVYNLKKRIEKVQNGHVFSLKLIQEFEFTSTPPGVEKVENYTLTSEIYYDALSGKLTISKVSLLDDIFSEEEGDFVSFSDYRFRGRIESRPDKEKGRIFDLKKYQLMGWQQSGKEPVLPVSVLSMIVHEKSGFATYWTGYEIRTNEVASDGDKSIDPEDANEKDGKFYPHADDEDEQKVPKSVYSLWFKSINFFVSEYYWAIDRKEKLIDSINKNKENLLTENSTDYYQTLNQLLEDTEDFHSGLFALASAFLYVNGNRQYDNENKQKVEAIKKAMAEKVNKEIEISNDGKTAIINLTQINYENENDKSILDKYLELTKKIKKDYPTVENLVINLAINKGGDVYAAVEFVAALAGPDKEIFYSEYNCATYKTDTTYARTTLKDTELPKFKRSFLQTSVGSFSSASMIAGIVRDNKIMPVIGTKTGGGASSTTQAYLPCGSVVDYSSDSVYLTAKKTVEAAHREAEFGVEPNYNYGFTEDYDNIANFFNPNYVAQKLAEFNLLD